MTELTAIVHNTPCLNDFKRREERIYCLCLWQVATSISRGGLCPITIHTLQTDEKSLETLHLEPSVRKGKFAPASVKLSLGKGRYVQMQADKHSIKHAYMRARTQPHTTSHHLPPRLASHADSEGPEASDPTSSSSQHTNKPYVVQHLSAYYRLSRKWRDSVCGREAAAPLCSIGDFSIPHANRKYSGWEWWFVYVV